jgi:hypothetical protein
MLLSHAQIAGYLEGAVLFANLPAGTRGIGAREMKRFAVKRAAPATELMQAAPPGLHAEWREFLAALTSKEPPLAQLREQCLRWTKPYMVGNREQTQARKVTYGSALLFDEKGDPCLGHVTLMDEHSRYGLLGGELIACRRRELHIASLTRKQKTKLHKTDKPEFLIRRCPLKSCGTFFWIDEWDPELRRRPTYCPEHQNSPAARARTDRETEAEANNAALKEWNRRKR